jgi:hypothetical protein
MSARSQKPSDFLPKSRRHFRLNYPSRSVYNESVARGWESKSVESQIESADRSRKSSAAAPPSSQQLQAERERDSLLLHRKRVLRDLENCSEERYRKTLHEGLAYLEQQLAKLGWKNVQS